MPDVTTAYKGTFIFEAAKFGWSESWYLAVGDGPSAMTNLRAMADDRSGLLGVYASIIAIKVTNPDIPGFSMNDSYSIKRVGLNTVGVIRGQPYDGIYCLAQDASRTYRRQMWIRGCFDDWIQFDPATGLPKPNGPMNDAIRNFRNNCIASKACLRVVSKDTAVAIRKPITGISLDPAAGPLQNAYQITCPAHGFVEGQSIRMGKNQGQNLGQWVEGKLYKVNAVWQVRNPTPNTFDINLIGSSAAPPFLRRGGYAVQRKIIYLPLANLTYQRFAKRDTGRNFFLPVGRRRAQQ